MSATTTHTSNLTNEAGFPPAPSEAHQKAYAKGDVQEVHFKWHAHSHGVRRRTVVERQRHTDLGFQLNIKDNYDD
ncbi:hypothetical protein [Caballeronia sp. dw_276]|uniref:hypothetical protein n=1 Tax=Caballeronia sp. dw_276 TaxID=2719795 RepID=UPI001BD5603A|nr:hypothetical protein [Caballeronia sp. dw_276]